MAVLPLSNTMPSSRVRAGSCSTVKVALAGRSAAFLRPGIGASKAQRVKSSATAARFFSPAVKDVVILAVTGPAMDRPNPNPAFWRAASSSTRLMLASLGPPPAGFLTSTVAGAPNMLPSPLARMPDESAVTSRVAFCRPSLPISLPTEKSFALAVTPIFVLSLGR